MKVYQGLAKWFQAPAVVEATTCVGRGQHHWPTADIVSCWARVITASYWHKRFSTGNVGELTTLSNPKENLNDLEIKWNTLFPLQSQQIFVFCSTTKAEQGKIWSSCCSGEKHWPCRAQMVRSTHNCTARWGIVVFSVLFMARLPTWSPEACSKSLAKQPRESCPLALSPRECLPYVKHSWQMAV